METDRRSGGSVQQRPAAGKGADLAAVDWRQSGVGVGTGIALDAAADAVQVEVKGGELDVGCENFAEPPRIKNNGVRARQTRSALAAQFATEIPALQRMHVLLQEGEIELQDVVQEGTGLMPEALARRKIVSMCSAE